MAAAPDPDTTQYYLPRFVHANPHQRRSNQSVVRSASSSSIDAQQLALDALAGQPITTLANQQQVSRKFVYQQLHHAQDALDQTFNPTDNDPPQLLFWLPVTKPWLRQLVLGLTLTCRRRQP